MKRKESGRVDGGGGAGGEGGSSSRTRRRSHNAALTTEFIPERLRTDQNQRLELTKDLSGTSMDLPGTPPPQWIKPKTPETPETRESESQL